MARTATVTAIICTNGPGNTIMFRGKWPRGICHRRIGKGLGSVSCQWIFYRRWQLIISACIRICRQLFSCQKSSHNCPHCPIPNWQKFRLKIPVSASWPGSPT